MNDAQALTDGVGLVLDNKVASRNGLRNLRLCSLRGALGIATLFALSVGGYTAMFLAFHHFLYGQI